MTKQIKLANNALAPLEATLLKNIKQPTTIHDARINLRRFYQCYDGNLRVYSEKSDKNGNPINVAEGSRENGKWKPDPWSELKNDPHPAIMFQCAILSDITTDINIEQLNNLSDIYAITNSGFGTHKHDPNFCMNIWMPNSPRRNWSMLRMEAHNYINHDFSSDWLECEQIYKLYDNNQSVLQKRMSFTNYMLKKNITVPLYQLNNRDKRYLHWLLLGPLAPYQFESQTTQQAA
jgi:hypothetical protein